tara:strand:+ start:1289 stop:1432 length:144 start_codon:yes stop_codon:yes gene_type:complete
VGTHWEHYDNGDYWLYREYDSEGGEITKEEWGYTAWKNLLTGVSFDV